MCFGPCTTWNKRGCCILSELFLKEKVNTRELTRDFNRSRNQYYEDTVPRVHSVESATCNAVSTLSRIYVTVPN